MRRRVKKIFATMLAGSMVMNALSFHTFAVENHSDIQIIEPGGKVYYLAEPNGETAGPENFDVWTSKTIAGTKNEDEFEITLQVGTTMKAVPNDVAVVLVVDTSGSMMSDEDGKKWENGNIPAGKKLRIEYARESALEFAEAYTTDSGNAKRMLAVVEFGSNAYAPLQWTDANDNGQLSDEVKEAIEAVDVNFKYDEGVSFWDKEKAEQDFPGKTECWDNTEKSAELKDYHKSFMNSYCSSSMEAFYSEIVVASPTNASPANAARNTTVFCPITGCQLTNEHIHCTYDGCSLTTVHEHCTIAGCTEKGEHVHCSKCALVTEHRHCDFPDCINAEDHTHCEYEACDEEEDHKHCETCGGTEEHSHIAGCTIEGCTDTTPDHVHYCV